MTTESILLLALFSVVQSLLASFILWMIVDAANKDRYLWLFLIILSFTVFSITKLPVLGISGSLVYMFLKKKEVYYKVTCKHCKNGVCTTHK